MSALRKRAAVLGALAMACAPVVASAAAPPPLFEERFDTDTSADFDQFSQDNDNTAGNDTAANFQFDYGNFTHWYTGADGESLLSGSIPRAPHTPETDTVFKGLRLDANNVSPAGTAIINVYPKLSRYTGGVLPQGDVKLTFDLWVNYNGAFEGGTGSTEFMSAGIQQQGGGIGASIPVGDPNLAGVGMAVNGDRGNRLDYRFYSRNFRVGGTDAVEQEGGYVAQDGGTGQPGPADGRNDKYEVEWFPRVNPNNPNEPWYETAGAIGKHWNTVEIKHEDGIVYYYITPDGYVPPAGQPAQILIAARTDENSFSGHLMMGYGDILPGPGSGPNPAAAEIGDGAPGGYGDHSFALFDNVVLEQVTQVRPKWNVNADGVWSDNTNWLNGSPNDKTHTADFTNAISGTGKTITVDGNQTVRAMVFDNTTPYTLNAGAGGKITLDSLTTGILGTIKVKSGSHTINAPIDTRRIVWVDAVAGSTLTINGAITKIVDPVNEALGPVARYLKKTGAGTLVLGGANAWDGDTRLEGGAITLTAAGAIPTNNARVTLSTGTTLNTNTFGFGTSRLTVNGATITGTGNITVEDHLFTTGTSSIGANVNFAPTVGFTGHRELVAPGALTISGALSGTAKLHQFSTGTGSLTVSGASTFTQPLAVRGGTLIVAADAPAGAPGPLGNSTAPVEVGDSTVTDLGTVQAGTTAALTGSPTFNAAANTLTWTAANSQNVNAIDGVTLANGDRILVKNQGTSSQNGVYVRNSGGTGVSAVWTRIAELNETTEFQYGTQATIGAGTVNNGRKYYLFAGSTLNAGTHSWAQEIADAGLLTGGPITIGRDVNVLNTVQTGTSTLGGATAHNSTFAGNVTISRPVTLTSVAGGNVKFTGNFTANSHALTKTGDGTVTMKNVRTSSVNVTAGTLAVTPDSGGTGVSNIGTLTIGANGRFDLGANKLVTNSAIGTATDGVYNGVHGEIQRAYNFGAWDMPGLTTSEENAGQNAGPLSGTTTIGVATAEQVMFLGPTETGVFAGQTVTGASTIAMYTYAGDVNFDGLVDGADYGTLDNWIQFPGTSGYANGDVNYDGVIDGADYGVLDNTIQLQGDPFPGVFSAFASDSGLSSAVAAVPEPSSCGLAVLAAAGLLGRRRRRSVEG